jgi:sialic acid synthase SpsE|tara:strand:+ start:326 stop:1357 length:1032 start_codon:yes stop_codon:yes gene_type:complete
MNKEQLYKQQNQCKVIAEIGTNHNGCWDTALKMLDQISLANADAAKFQYYRADKLYPESTRAADYLIGTGGIEKGTRIVDLLKKAEIPEEWLDELVIQCESRNIDLIISVFDVESVDVLVRHGIRQLKVASSEITHYPLLSAVGKTGLPVILSTGMSNLGMIESALKKIGHDNVVLLHCTAAYPVPDKEVNLHVIQTLQSVFGLPVGFSDHTEDTLAADIAFALGAVMVEKHFTLDKNQPGPDHAFSVTPQELSELTDAVRRTGQMLGGGRKIITEKESETMGYTPGLFASCDIAEGSDIKANNIEVRRRNKEGLGTEFLDIVKERKARVLIPKGAPITWDKI